MIIIDYRYNTTKYWSLLIITGNVHHSMTVRGHWGTLILLLNKSLVLKRIFHSYYQVLICNAFSEVAFKQVEIYKTADSEDPDGIAHCE